jgi:signal transduction histidine kinase
VAQNPAELASDELIFSALTFHHPIHGINGDAIATIRGTFSAPAIEKLNDTLHRNLLWGGVTFTLLLIGVGSILGLTIVQPLGQIIRSLDTRDPVHLSHLLVAKSDFGEIARLISSQFRRGRMLQEEIRRRGNITTTTNGDHTTNEALRLRLASNLHDGPMQSLYAARLKLGAMHSSTKNNTPPSAEDLGGISDILEECSKDLRNLLLDIEPEELRDQGLASTLPRFEKHLQNLATEAATFRVSSDAFEGCSRATQIQLLYLIRELVSNIGRHARPQFITFVIERTHDSLILTCENDGLKQRPAAEPSNGLNNIGQRVGELGGSWKQEVTRKKTWFVQITLPIPTKLDQPLTIEDA